MSQTKTMLKVWLQDAILKFAARNGTVSANDVRPLLFHKFEKELRELRYRDDHNFIGSAFGVLVRQGEIKKLPQRVRAQARVRHGNEVNIFELV